MKIINRTVQVLKKDGLRTFFYLVKTNLAERQSPAKKYQQWIKRWERSCTWQIEGEERPFFSIFLTGETDEHGVSQEQRSVSSLQKLHYDAWEVIHADDSMTMEELLQGAKGDYIGILGCGDVLSEDCLTRIAFEIVSAYKKREDSMTAGDTDIELLYTDEDIIDQAGMRKNPFFKPDYSPDTLRAFFYMGGFFVCRKELIQKLSYSLQRPLDFGGYLLAMEAVLYLEQGQLHGVAAKGYSNEYGWLHRQCICHIPEVLYHRSESTGKVDVHGLAEKKRALFEAYGILIDTEHVVDCEAARVVYRLERHPKVSIIIPSKDNPSMLGICLNSIEKFTSYDNYEIIIVDNGSNAAHRREYEELCGRQKVECRYLYKPMEFNFSYMCNQGAKKACGEYYLFLNDDIEITDLYFKSRHKEDSTDKHNDVDWMMRLLGQAMQPHTGAVGAKLLYPNTNLIQHVGIVNYESGAAHIFSKMPDDGSLLFGRNRMDYNYSVVTGACTMVSKEKFEQVGGFLEELAVTFNDVELCFRLFRAGYYQVVRNDVILYHHESITRGEDALDPDKYYRHLKEREKLFALHPFMVKRDFFYSPHLTQKKLDGTVNIEEYPVNFEVFMDEEKHSVMSDGELVCRVEYAQAEGQTVCIRGFAFLQTGCHNNWNRTYVVLKGKKETLYVRTMKLYNPTIAPQMGSSNHLNFTEFYTNFQRKYLKETRYQIGIMLKPFSGRQRLLNMTDTCLENIWK